MEFIFFPDPQSYDPQRGEFKDQTGDVGKEIKDLSKRHRDLYLRVKTFLEVLLKVSDLTPFLRIEQIYKFPKEFLLCAELKHKTKPMKLEVAMQKLKQYKELVKQGVMS